MADDYIMRLLRQMAAVLAGIIAKKEAGRFVEAKEEVEQTCLQTIGLSLSKVKQLAPDALAQLLDKTGASRHLNAITLAELLLLEAALPESQGGVRPPSPSHVHAFCLLADSIDALGKEEQVIYRAKLDLLADQLGNLRKHPYIKERLRDYGTAKRE